MSTAIVRSRAAITRALDEVTCETLPDCALLIRNGLIEEVGTYDDLSRRFPRLPVLGSGKDVMIPGFVNAHHHVGLTPFQLGAADLPLELWVSARMAGREVDPYLDTLFSAFELIAAGVTTVQHIVDTSEGTVETVKAKLDAVISAYGDVGMRASVCYGIADQNFLVHRPDHEFLAGLPSHLADPLAAMLSRIDVGLEGGLALFEALHREHVASQRIRVQLAPANLHWCSDKALERIGETADRVQVPVHMHLLETPLQRDYARGRGGESAFAQLKRFGLGNDRLTIGHGVWLGENEMDAVAACGASVCVNCSSNLRLRSGVVNLPALVERGINIAIGIDEAGLSDDRDMLQEIRLAQALSGRPGVEGGMVPAARMFKMATEGGALTTPFGAVIGTIEAGRKADLVLFDWDRLSDPYLDPGQPYVVSLLRRAKPDTVRTVLCDGETIYKNGKFTKIDQQGVLAELRNRMRAALTPEEVERQRIAAQLMPHVRRFYGFSC